MIADVNFHFEQTEVHLYGSSRLGIDQVSKKDEERKKTGETVLFYNPFLQTWDIDCAIIEPLAQFEPQKTFEPTDEDPDLEVINCVSYLGYKRYELTNHLGNVLVTVSDKSSLIQMRRCRACGQKCTPHRIITLLG